MDYAFRRRITMNLVNPDSNSIVVPDTAFSAMAKASTLEAPRDGQSMTKKDIPQIEKLIALNKNALSKMRTSNLKNKLEHIKVSLMALTGAGIYYICDGIFNLIGLPSYPMLPSSPYINEELSEFGGLVYTGGDMLLDHARLNFLLAFKDMPDYKNAESIVKQRITLFSATR
jgi:hypothetical protein